MNVTKCVKHNDHEGNHNATELELTPVYDDGCEENKTYWDATPSGSMSLWINNVDALPDDIAVGDEYYIDLTPVAKAPQA